MKTDPEISSPLALLELWLFEVLQEKRLTVYLSLRDLKRRTFDMTVPYGSCTNM